MKMKVGTKNNKMKDITRYTTEQLQRVSGMWLVKSTELQWKANKMKSRLEKRLEREAKRRATLEPTEKLLSTANIVLEALLPHGESEAVTLVRAQIEECEAKIKSVSDKYNFMHEAEIALKWMDIELIQLRANMAKAAKAEVEAELASRVEVVEVAEVVQTSALANISSATSGMSSTKQNVFTKALSAVNSKKVELELSILKSLRQAPNAVLRLRGYQKAAKSVNLLRLKSNIERVGVLMSAGRWRLAI